MPDDTVIHVGGAMPDAGMLLQAINTIPLDGEGTIIVHGSVSYDEAATVNGGRVIAFLANNGDSPIWTRQNGVDSPQLAVNTGATVLFGGIQFSGNDSSSEPALRVNGGQVWVERGRIVWNDGGGIVVENSGALVLRNSFVGDGTNGDNALTVDGASAEVLYSTLGTGFDNFGDVFPVFCIGNVTVSIRNSLLISLDDGEELSCSMATVTNTASETLISGMGNVALGDVGMSWFVDITAGDFHLNNPPSILATTAVWETDVPIDIVGLEGIDDPSIDIDGEPRPDSDGTADYTGADVP
ncbi:MAG: hypothetical protein AAGF11_36100 [Myxococcota bacterium]